MNNEQIKIGDAVSATITRNGYFHKSYKGTVIGFTNNGRIKVKNYMATRCHAPHNVKLISTPL